MNRSSRATCWCVCAAVLVLGWGGAAAARAPDATYRAAVRLLEAGITPRRDGRHNALLRALRHLNTPSLRPLFARMAELEHPAIRVHGILGLAEVSDPPRLGLSAVATIEATAVQAELLSAALDGELLADADARTLLGWSDLDAGVKLLILARMIEAGRFDEAHRPVLREAMASDNLARSSLAALLLLETGDEDAMDRLMSLRDAQDASRDRVQVMLLETALRHELGAIAPWASAVARDAAQDPRVRDLAMRAAMRFGDRRAVDLWRSRLINEPELAERIRLALMGLHLSPWLDAGVFEPMIADDQPFIRQAGRTAAAVSRHDADRVVEVVELLQTYHPLAARWALTYAREVAAPEDAHQVLLGLVLLYEHGPEAGRRGRLADAAEAARVLHDLAGERARRLLRPIIASQQTDDALIRAVLLGLVRAKDADAGLALEGLDDFPHPTTNQLALLLRLRSGQDLSNLQQKDLSVLIRGGGQVEDPLRIQAGWLYLARTGQAERAIEDATATIQP